MPHRHSVYVIDDRDRVASVSDLWTEFAAENGASGLAERALGQVLWTFISGDETKAIYRTLFDRVRGGRTVRVPYRCDAPARVREFELEMAPGGHGSVVCTTYVVAERDRPPMRLIDALAERSDGFLHMCGWCKRVDVGEWVEPEVAVERLGLFGGGPVPQVTHGICEDCTRRVLASA
jgi:hypothetical protein